LDNLLASLYVSLLRGFEGAAEERRLTFGDWNRGAGRWDF
jgi:hypothetical protein